MYEVPFQQHNNIQQQQFLITGGAGFIGSHIVQYLLQHNAQKVRVLDDLSTGSRSNVDIFQQHPAYEFMEGDVRDFEICFQACEGIDVVSHQAAIGSVPRSIDNPIYTTSVNVDGFVNVVKAAYEQDIKRVVYASSSSVYGDEITLPKIEHKIGKPLSPYAVSKLTNELYADVFGQVYNMELIGYRYFNIFGPRQSPSGPYAAVIPLFMQGLINGTPVYINGDGEQSRDFTFVSNAVQANILGMLTTNKAAVNQVYNVAVGERFSINQLYNNLAQLIGSKQKSIHRAERMGDVKHSLANIDKAKQLLAYQPATKFKDGLEVTLDFFKVTSSQ